LKNYTVGFSVWTAKALKTQDGENCDCFVVVECGDGFFQTGTMENSSGELVSWSETHIWPQIPMFQSQFESAIIEFTVYSRNWFFRNWVIGKTSLQLEYVNKRKNKLYARALLPLRRDDDPLITGMLDISVFVLKPGEAAPSRTLQMTPSIEDEDRAEGDKDDDLADLGKAMLSGDIDTGNILKYHVYIYIHKVEELPFLENGYKPSPFLTVDFVGCQVKTQVAPETQQFAFQAGIRIPVMTPLAEDKIVVKLWHNNYFSSDQLLAQGFFSFRQMRNNGLPTQWFCLYGWDPAECPDIESIVRSGESA